MSLGNEIARTLPDQFVTLILDNEVTVGHFVTDPPLPWTRLARIDGRYQVSHSAPIPLTLEQTRIEMKIWDEVSTEGILNALSELDDSVNYVLIGNNAGQGLPLAKGVPGHLVQQAGIIYGASLPEKKAYEELGYRSFFQRSDAVTALLERAKEHGKPLSLVFINTIQHNERNYHDP